MTLGNAQGGSSLFLSVWDNARQLSYTRNLGLTLNTFLPTGLTTLPTDGGSNGFPVIGDKTPAVGLELVFPTGDNLFQTAFAASNPNNLRWNIAAYDDQSKPSSGLARVITTASAPPAPKNRNIDSIVTGGGNYLEALLVVTQIATQNAVTQSINVFNASYAGNANWGSELNSSGVESAGIGFSGSLGFYYLARSAAQYAPNQAPDAAATVLPYGNANQFARWTLSSDGTATYTLAAVPLPASAWLFLAGLGAFAGFARRSQARRRPVHG